MMPLEVVAPPRICTAAGGVGGAAGVGAASALDVERLDVADLAGIGFNLGPDAALGEHVDMVAVLHEADGCGAGGGLLAQAQGAAVYGCFHGFGAHERRNGQRQNTQQGQNDHQFPLHIFQPPFIRSKRLFDSPIVP